MKIRNEEYNRKDVRVGLMNKEEELRNKNEKWFKTKITKRLNLLIDRVKTIIGISDIRTILRKKIFVLYFKIVARFWSNYERCLCMLKTATSRGSLVPNYCNSFQTLEDKYLQHYVVSKYRKNGFDRTFQKKERTETNFKPGTLAPNGVNERFSFAYFKTYF